MATVLKWNGTDVPDELRKLPQGRYVIESVDAMPSLTAKQEQGLEDALDALDRGQRVFDDVVEQAGGDGDDVEFHVGEEVGDGQRVNQVGLAGVADLAPVFEGGKDIGAPQQLDVQPLALDGFSKVTGEAVIVAHKGVVRWHVIATGRSLVVSVAR